MTKNDIKDASLATVILGVTALFCGMVSASAAPTDEPGPAYSVELPAEINSVGGADLSFESHGGASLGK